MGLLEPGEGWGSEGSSQARTATQSRGSGRKPRLPSPPPLGSQLTGSGGGTRSQAIWQGPPYPRPRDAVRRSEFPPPPGAQRRQEKDGGWIGSVG